jgi:hypothetical protein
MTYTPFPDVLLSRSSHSMCQTVSTHLMTPILSLSGTHCQSSGKGHAKLKKEQAKGNAKAQGKAPKKNASTSGKSCDSKGKGKGKPGSPATLKAKKGKKHNN